MQGQAGETVRTSQALIRRGRKNGDSADRYGGCMYNMRDEMRWYEIYEISDMIG